MAKTGRSSVGDSTMIEGGTLVVVVSQTSLAIF
jgi:hypothetical protein